jgi:hypothetical protein
MTETEPMQPTEPSGTEATRFNALKHGVLSRYTVLPWEDGTKYHALVTALVSEHAPQGRPRNISSRNWPGFSGENAA